MTTLTIICAYCGADLGTKDGQGISGVTSGMCPACYKKEQAKLTPTMRIKDIMQDYAADPTLDLDKCIA